MTTGPHIPFQTQPRYPDPSIELLDRRFLKLRLFSSSVEQLASGLRWAEGPVWFGDGRYLLLSDIPNNRILRWDDASGLVSEFRAPSHNANGLARDHLGRLLTCEHQTRRVTRTEYNGSVTVLADRFDGKRLNSPNDIVCQRNGAVWFTDPPFGIGGDWEGDAAPAELPHAVYRIDPHSGVLQQVLTDLQGPNGLAFSPDESILYIADTGASHRTDGPRHIRKFAVEGDRLKPLGVFAQCGSGLFDGFRVDAQGRLWTSAGDGVHVYHPDGTLIGKVLVPEIVANVCFAGEKRNRLLICATSSLYAVYLNTTGLA